MRVYWDAVCLSHNPPHEILSGKLVPYYESPDRVRKVKQALEENGTFQILPAEDDWPQIREHILAVHSHDYLEYLETIYDEWVAIGGDKSAVFPETFRHSQLQNVFNRDIKTMSPFAKAGDAEHKGNYTFDMSCPITSDTYRAAIASVKVALCAARALLGGDRDPSSGIFALARPPGHHAQQALCGGYCFFNNAAIAARYLLQQGGARRVAILDIDYHHGNGTQQIFYTDPSVVYISLHAKGDYPYFTGAADEHGSGDGAGFNHNFPLPTGSTTDDVYCDALQKATDVGRSHNDVDFLVVSLGADTYSGDPICEFLLTQRCYPRIGGIIASLHIPTLFVMEG
ncbi:Arginase/deacetylase [Lentinus tigrinus ALCF2SS1-6]|uniref:Arginase/deacetylase n=1 Tax=Lentinus tigrinus ALCF2SS1-6 TaxID=1328759 RepID=A0A5C2SME1_9APHY|nr:Arginase/deacetylase [Lentinus tigrinus ALCF2SS1-6]